MSREPRASGALRSRGFDVLVALSPLGDFAGYLPGQAGTILALPSPRAAATAAVTMCAYAALALLGASLAIRRDLA
jgi:hypothetical protein